MEKRKRVVNKVPLLDDSYDLEKIHPAMNFRDSEAMFGFWVPTKLIWNDDTESTVRNLVLWNGRKLEFFYDWVATNNCLKESDPIFFDLRVSKDLLASNKLPNKTIEYLKQAKGENSLFKKNQNHARNLVNKCKDVVENKPPLCFSDQNTPNQYQEDKLMKKCRINVQNIPDIEKNKINTLQAISLQDVLIYDYIINKINNNEFLNYIFTPLHQKLRYYLDLDDEHYLVICLWIIGTYLYELYDAFPYLFIHGTKRAGKTSILKFIDKVAFNSILTGSTTASAVFRLVDSIKPTMLIDETDSISTGRNKAELRQILLNGYKKSGFVTRARKDKNEKYIIDRFNAYSPKALVNITGIDDVLEDRTIYINNKRAIDKKFGERMSNLDRDKDFQHIRNLLYVYVVSFYPVIKKKIQEFKNNSNIANRDWELWKPILFLATEIGMYDEMLKIAEEKIREKQAEESVDQIDSLIVEIISKEMGNSKDIVLTAKTIRERYNENLDEDDFKISSIRIGTCMKRLGFKNKLRQKSGIQYKITKSEVDDAIKRHGLRIENTEKSKTEREIIEDWIRENSRKEIRFAELNMIWEEKFGREKDDYIYEIYSQMKKDGKIMEVRPEWIKSV